MEKIYRLREEDKGNCDGFVSCYLYFSDGKELHIFGYFTGVHRKLDEYKGKRYLLHLVFHKDGPRYSKWEINIGNGKFLYFHSPKDQYLKYDDYRRYYQPDYKFIPNKERKFILTDYPFIRCDYRDINTFLKFRKIPKKWIPEFDQVIEEYNRIWAINSDG